MYYYPQRGRLAPALAVPPSERGVLVSSSGQQSSSVGMPMVFVCDTLEVVGCFVLLAVLLTAWRSTRVSRSSTWFLFIFSCLLSSASTLLIFGRQGAKQPAWDLCLVQASFIYSSAVFTAFSGAAFVLQIYLAMMSVDSTPRIAAALISFTLHVVPFLISLGICVMSLFILRFRKIGLFDPSLVMRDQSGIRCHIDRPLVSHITAGAGMSGVIVVLILQGYIAYKLCRSRRIYQQRLDRSRTPFTVVIRVFVFTFLAFILLIIGLLTYLPAHQTNSGIYSLYNVIIAALPLGAALVFGTQKDIINVWLFWRPSSQSTTTSSTLIQSESGVSDVGSRSTQK